MRSMTGCGSGRIQREGWEVTAELKTVNHRFLDISMRLPRNISFLEQTVREEISTEGSSTEIVTDLELAKQYLEAGLDFSEALGTEDDLTVSRLFALEGVVTVTETEPDQELLKAICSEAVRVAAAQLVSMREREGEHLKEDLSYHLEQAAMLREKILSRAPGVVADYMGKLESRIKTLVQDGVDPVRIAQEVALMADRCAIDEELARLESHIREMRIFLEAKDEIGKKMDFLIQEMNRETNTIGSKAQDAEIAKMVVDLKSEIEKLREQVQNVE